MKASPSAWAAFSVFVLVFGATSATERGTLAHKSSCGGSTPWKCPYIAFKNGPNCHEVSISSPSECQAAAAALGYSANDLQDVNDAKAPHGCYVGEKTDNWANVFFNRHPTGNVHSSVWANVYSSEYRTICHNTVSVNGAVGIGRDWTIGDGRGSKGVVRNIQRSGECCRKCWRDHPGTQLFAHNIGFKKCTCLYKIPGETLSTYSVYNRQSTGFCAAEGPAPSPDCFDYDKDYPGMDINLHTARTRDLKQTFLECQSLCQSTPGCNFFTWTKSNKRCYLKSRKSEVNYETGAISGPKKC